MGLSKSLSLSLSLILALSFSLANAAMFTVRNNCRYTVWAAAAPRGGQRLENGQNWTINIPAGTTGARIWPRTGCSFDGAGRGGCATGDCNGQLICTQYGSPPNTLAEIGLKQYMDLDFFDISLVDGFNVPMQFSPNSGGCGRDIRCTADINRECPDRLRARDGCNNPCTVYKTNEYCCYPNSPPCGPTDLSRFFKERCPDAYSYPQDDKTSKVVFTCPSGTDYTVVFCP